VSGTAKSDKVVILDRDGTLVIDRGYMDDPAQLEFEPGAASALRWWHEHGYRMVVITNQSGIGRGYFSAERAEEMNARLHAMVEALGCRLERTYYCPHRPDAGCNCRKPAPGLLIQAASELGFDPRRTVVIGDKPSDIELGQGAGAKTILITADSSAPTMRVPPDLVTSNLLDAARVVTTLGW
jgi:D-glycero-D-manno-heptose 1,7-bisphosphate phosphatase